MASENQKNIILKVLVTPVIPAPDKKIRGQAPAGIQILSDF
jgi:hypothetical protein